MVRSPKKAAVILLALLTIFTVVAAAAVDSRQLSVNDKIKDFDYLCNAIESGQPMLDEYKKIIGYDFNENKQYYQSLISNTNNDYEYYVILRMIMEEFPSIHTDIIFGTYEDAVDAGYRVLKSCGEVRDKAYYWQEYENRFLSEQSDRTVFMYYDGHYISNQCNIADNSSQTLELLEIDGENIHTYITNKEVNGRLAWDNQNNQAYRFSVSLNLSYGKIVTALFRNENDEVFERQVCIRNKSYAFEENKLPPIKTPMVNEYIFSEPEVQTELISGEGRYFYAVSDSARNTSYINIYNFNNDYGFEISEALKKACQNDNIILDLRYNSGGYVEFFLEYVYPYLFVHDINAELVFYANYSTANEKMFADSINDMQWENYTNETVMHKQEFHGYGYCNAEKNIYVLISNMTSSAADTASGMLKNNTDSVLIGCRTAGEGLGDTACVDVLPSSGILFSLQYTQAFNSDGTDNSVYGTSPHIYLANDFEAVAKRNQIANCSQDPYIYENRMKWDNVLIDTLEIIKEKENTK